jgi:hypothetical protein
VSRGLHSIPAISKKQGKILILTKWGTALTFYPQPSSAANKTIGGILYELPLVL